MKSLVRFGCVFAGAMSLTSLVACGGGGEDEGEDEVLANPGFITPTVVTEAFVEEDDGYVSMGPADWSCLNTPTADVPLGTAITINGELEDFQSEDPIEGGEMHIYSDVKGFANAGDDQTISDEDGNYSLTMAAGAERAAFKVTARGQLDTYHLNQALTPEGDAMSLDLTSVSELTAATLPAFVGKRRTLGLGILAGVIFDCRGYEVAGAISTVSSVSGVAEHQEGAETFYFSADLSSSLPVRHTQAPATREDGRLVVIEVEPGQETFLQVWGYVDGQTPGTDDLTLLGEIPSPVYGDSVVISDIEPLRTN